VVKPLLTKLYVALPTLYPALRQLWLHSFATRLTVRSAAQKGPRCRNSLPGLRSLVFSASQNLVLETCRLPRGVTRTVLLELLDHAVEVGIAGAKAPCEPVPTALGNPLAVSDYLELPDLSRRSDSFNVQALLDEGHETRDLGLVVLSRRAVHDLDLHSVLPI
jgi:hypothetical protein